MVAKISIGNSLYGALAYNAQKVNAGEGKLLALNRVFDGGDGRMDCTRLLRDFCNCMPENIRTRNTVIHISLNPHPDDRLTDMEMANIAQIYMERLGYGNQPYVIVKHEDIDRHHVHIVSVNVDEKGKRIDKDFLFRRSERIRKKLEKEFNLHPDERKTAKTAFRGTPTIEKTEKTTYSVDGIVKKTAKTANSVGRIIKKRKKPAFPTLGKVRTTRFLRFPTLGKIKITHFLRFSLERKAVVAHRKRP